MNVIDTPVKTAVTSAPSEIDRATVAISPGCCVDDALSNLSLNMAAHKIDVWPYINSKFESAAICFLTVKIPHIKHKFFWKYCLISNFAPYVKYISVALIIVLHMLPQNRLA